MKRKTIPAIAMIALALLTFGACQKEGPKGDAGTNGKDGNANVVSSSVFTEPTNWGYSNPSWYLTLINPAITQEIIDKGAVLVFMRSNSSPEAFTQLPFTFYESANYSSTYNLEISLGLVKVIRTDSDLAAPTQPGYDKFKVVVIAASQLADNPGVDLTDYEAVKEAFDL